MRSSKPTNIITAILVLYVLCSSFLVHAQSIVSNIKKEPPFNLQEIRTRLIFRSSVKETDKQANENLISELNKRGIGFMVLPDDEKLLRKAGANDRLIKVIKDLSEKIEPRLKEKNLLYQVFLDNYSKTSSEQKMVAIDAANEFIKKFGNDEDCAEIVRYLKVWIPRTEKNLREIQ